MKTTLRFSITIYIVFISAFTINAQPIFSGKYETLLSNSNDEKPHIAFSFDDGSINNILSYDNEDWNSMIRKHLKDNRVQAIWFVAGKIVDNDKGKHLLKKWNDDGHIIANHTYSHLDYNDSLLTI